VGTYFVKGWCKATGEMMEGSIDAETTEAAKRHAEAQGLSLVVVSDAASHGSVPGRTVPPDRAPREPASHTSPGRVENSIRLVRIEQALDAEVRPHKRGRA
jgi:hypothetical protein